MLKTQLDDMCLICQNPTRQLYATSMNIINCTHCGFVQQSVKNYLEFLQNDQNKHYDTSLHTNKTDYQDSDWYLFDYLKCVKMVDQFRPESVLDVGAGWGRFMKAMTEHGVERVVGLEFSKKAAEYCQNQGLKISNHTLENYEVDAQYDLINLTQVAEHIHEPHDAFANAYKLLTPRGRLIIETGNVASIIAKFKRSKWNYFMPEHVAFYSPKTIVALLQSVGFKKEDIKVRIGSMHFLQIYLCMYLMGKKDIIYGKGLGITKLIRAFLHPIISSTMTIEAQKQG